MQEIDFVAAFLWFSAFLFSTTVHEAMHAWAAYRGGDPTVTTVGRCRSLPFLTLRASP